MPTRKTRPLSKSDEARIQAQIKADPDDSDISPREAALAKPFAEAFPGLAQSIRRARGRPPLAKPRQHVSLRLDPEVIAKFKKAGKGWQTRMNDALRKAAGL